MSWYNDQSVILCSSTRSKVEVKKVYLLELHEKLYNKPMTQFKSAQEFLEQAEKFQLGPLVTEAPHPETTGMSEQAKSHPLKAMQAFKDVDLDALEIFFKNSATIQRLSKEIFDTLASGNRVYLSGCGATGRLCLNVQRICYAIGHFPEQIIAFMAGGDVALVHSLEGFEDYEEYGARHLNELGFTENDLLIAITEGGETPFVIGTVEEAQKISKRKPFFLYCNPDKALQGVERSERVFANSNIIKVNLNVGPMALAGSTRLQASTVQMLAVGLALFFENEEQRQHNFREFFKFYNDLDVSLFTDFISAEEESYSNGHQIIYQVNPEEAIVVFTDTTERSPTFSLPPFESRSASQLDCDCYIGIDMAETAEESWQALLARTPHQLNWPEADSRTSLKYLQGFDFGRSVNSWRRAYKPIDTFSIHINNGVLEWAFKNNTASLNLKGQHKLFEHLTLKMLLNMHSTLLMGRMDRYESNIMTWVRPSNGKLIDRTARCVLWLLQQKLNFEITYEQVIEEIFEQAKTLKRNEALVLKVFKSLVDDSKTSEAG